MRTEMKIALGLFATNTILGHLLSAPEFVRGLLFGLSIFFMIIGLLSESAYLKLKVKQTEKFFFFKKMVRMN